MTCIIPNAKTKLRELFVDNHINSSSSPLKFGYCEAWKEENRTTHFLIIGGTHYDKGFFYGKFLAEAIHTVIKNILRFSSRIGLGNSKLKLTKEVYFQKIYEIYSQAGEHRLAELQGVIDGCKSAGLPFENELEVGIGMAFFELNEAACCSSCAVHPPTSIKDTYQINTSEFPFPIGCQDNPVILLYYPQENDGNRKGLAHFSVSFAGLLAGVAGINEKGVAFGSIRLSNIKDVYSPNGTPFLYLMNDAIEQNSHLSEMRQFINSHSRTNGYIVTVSEPSQKEDSLNLWVLGHHIFEYFQSGQEIERDIFQGDSKYYDYHPIQSSVHWMDMPVPGIEAGPEVSYEVINKYKGKINDEIALKMSNHFGSRYAVVSSVFNTSKMYGWISFAKKKVPSHLEKYHFIDFKKYFNSYERLSKGPPSFVLLPQ